MNGGSLLGSGLRTIVLIVLYVALFLLAIVSIRYLIFTITYFNEGDLIKLYFSAKDNVQFVLAAGVVTFAILMVQPYENKLLTLLAVFAFAGIAFYTVAGTIEISREILVHDRSLYNESIGVLSGITNLIAHIGLISIAMVPIVSRPRRNV